MRVVILTAFWLAGCRMRHDALIWFDLLSTSVQPLPKLHLNSNFSKILVLVGKTLVEYWSPRSQDRWKKG